MSEIHFKEDELIVSKTDTKGRITYCNEMCLNIAGYSEEELLGAPHNILRHPDMPKVIFKLLWETIQSGKEIYAYVVNKTKSGDYYWVCANVTPSFDSKGNIIGYYSVRRKPKQQALDAIKPLYKKMLEAEIQGGIQASRAMIDELLEAKGKRYDEFILSL